MTGQSYTDDELAARIAAGDWAGDVEAPRVDTISGLVSRRRRRRTAAAGGCVGVVAAAVVAGALALHGSSPLPKVASQPAATDVTSPTAAVSQPDGPANCLSTQSRLQLSRGAYGGTTRRPTQVVFVENIGRHPCSIPEPALSVGFGRNDPNPVSVTSVSRGPWTLPSHQALILTVTAPRPSTCMRSNARLDSHQISVELPGWTYSFPFPGMNVVNCDPPTVSAVRVGPPPAS
jgi:hypothetical protein